MTTYQKYRRTSESYRKLTLALLAATVFTSILFIEFFASSNLNKARVEKVSKELEEVKTSHMDLLEASNELNDLQNYKFNQSMQGKLQEAYTVQDRIDELEERLEEL